jgi:chromosomal replication initiation ATPase DnaA
MLIPGLYKSSDDNDIIRIVEDYYQIKGSSGVNKKGHIIYINGLKTKAQFDFLVLARQVAMYLTKKHTKKTLQIIANEFNMKNHSSALSAVKHINDLLSYDKKLQSEIEEIENILTLNN